MSSPDAFRKLIATPEPPRLGPQGRPGTLDAASLNRALADFCVREKTAPSLQPLLRAAALLWHDHFDAAHAIAQDIGSREGSWLHAILHRREPDCGNSKYWFHRVGDHEAFPALAQRVAGLKDAGPFLKRLLDGSDWLPLAFVEECDRAGDAGALEDQRVLRNIQALEFDVLVEHLFGH